MAQEKYLIYLLLLAFFFVPLFCWAIWRRTTLLGRYAQNPLLGKLNHSFSYPRAIFKYALICLAFAAIVIALCRPRWNARPKEVHRSGRDVVILLDVSRSMLAEDLNPNRLERAKIAIKDLMEQLEGDKIAIVTFAGSATVKAPLTQDYAFVRMILDQIDTESTAVGGTNLGDAIRKAADEIFDETAKQYKDIILISDGGDLEKSLPQEAAKKAAEMGVRIIAVGLGDPVNGARIPVVEENGQKSFLTYEGQQVWTKLESDTLRKVALSTPQGVYMPVETGNFDLGGIYKRLIASAEKRKLEATTSMEYDEGFQIFILLSIVLLSMEILTGQKRKTVRVAK